MNIYHGPALNFYHDSHLNSSLSIGNSLTMLVHSPAKDGAKLKIKLLSSQNKSRNEIQSKIHIIQRTARDNTTEQLGSSVCCVFLIVFICVIFLLL
jgi:hypothetical protein